MAEQLHCSEIHSKNTCFYVTKTATYTHDIISNVPVLNAMNRRLNTMNRRGVLRVLYYIVNYRVRADI